MSLNLANRPPSKCRTRSFVPDFVMELGLRLWNAGLDRFVLYIGIGLPAQTVVAPMSASECRRYAEQCLQLAQHLAPQHRNLLLKWADEWKKVAEELEELEGQDAQEEQFGNKQKNG